MLYKIEGACICNVASFQRFNPIENLCDIDGHTFRTPYQKDSLRINFELLKYKLMQGFTICTNLYRLIYPKPYTLERSTTLSKYKWKLILEGAPYDLDWMILSRAKVFSPVTRTCHLYLREKYFIMFQPESASLNSRDELQAQA